MSFLNNLNTWMLWSPVWLPMIFVITPPLSEFCNFRTGIFLFLLLFIRWNRGHLGHWSHMLKNAKWTTFLFTILVPRLWPTRIERHCDQCETMLAAQFQMVRNFTWNQFRQNLKSTWKSNSNSIIFLGQKWSICWLEIKKFKKISVENSQPTFRRFTEYQT